MCHPNNSGYSRVLAAWVFGRSLRAGFTQCAALAAIPNAGLSAIINPYNLIFDLEGLLNEPFGDNLRNDLSHGLVEISNYILSLVFIRGGLL